MPTNLLLPAGTVPSNLHLDPRVQRSFVESDVYNICERLLEVSPRLFVEEFVDQEKGAHSYAIMELCDDGVARLVFKTKQLDARVIEKCQYLLHVPFKDRLELAERIEEENNRRQHEMEMERLYEQVGAPMLRQLHKDGFTDSPVSYPIVRRK